MRKILIYLSLAALVWSCGATVTSSFTSPKKELTIEDKVAFLDTHHIVPSNALKIGDAHFGDSGFSIDCDFNSNLINARKLARKNGANIVKIIEKKTPDLWSSCYRLKIEFYYYEGNVSDLPQYSLQIN